MYKYTLLKMTHDLLIDKLHTSSLSEEEEE